MRDLDALLATAGRREADERSQPHASLSAREQKLEQEKEDVRDLLQTVTMCCRELLVLFLILLLAILVGFAAIRPRHEAALLRHHRHSGSTGAARQAHASLVVNRTLHMTGVH